MPVALSAGIDQDLVPALHFAECPFVIQLDHGIPGHKGNNAGDAKFCGFLQHPFEFVRFDQCRAQCDFWSLFLGFLFAEQPDKRFFLHMSQPHFPITDHAYRFPGACPKHIKQMMGLLFVQHDPGFQSTGA